LTSTRSARGRTLTDAMLVWFLLVVLVLVLASAEVARLSAR
jgi:hypothetical protein